MYTITHRCGHTRTTVTRHGRLEPSTLRSLANSLCDDGTRLPKRYTMPNLYRGGNHAIEYDDIRFMRRDAEAMIAAGAPRIAITDRVTGQQIVIAKDGPMT